ncbi:ESPR-type extended signal peptide-containing protein [Psychrobacter sp. AT9]|uniref:ESPR-type extended signal peptide-containing protein n=1 Tax=Psychrobacter sp. AT9 TaxID=3242893 RepID=UPI0039A5800F
MNRNYKVIWNKSLGCFTAVAEYAKSRGKSSNSAVSSTSSASAAVSTGARLLRLSSLTVALAATGLTLSTQVLAETGTLGGVGDGTAISVCTGIPVDGVVNTDNAANAVTPNSIAIGCNTSTGDRDFNLLDAGNPNNGDAGDPNNPGASNPGGVLYSSANSDTVSSSTVVGSNAAATGNLSTAYGSQARAIGGSSVALGVAAVATADGAIATGLQSAATGRFSQASGVVSSATGDGSTAIGHSSNASGYRSIAIGATDLNNDPLGYGGYGYNEADATRATADNTIAFGGGAKATADQAVAIGLNAEANGVNSVALGQNSTIANDAPDSVAMGSQNTVNATNNVTNQQIGDRRGAVDPVFAYPTGTTVNTAKSVAIGNSNSTGLGGGVSMGNNNQVTSDFHGIALGQGNLTSGSYGVGLGVGNLASDTSSVALGTSNRSTGNSSVAIGRQSYALADFSIAAGGTATVGTGATNGIALGTSSNVAAAGVNSIAIGTNSNAGDVNSVAIGSGSQATGSSTISIGTGNIVSGNNSGAIGDPSTITGTGSYSLGNDNTIDADNAFAIGNNISIAAGLDGAVGIGNNTTVAESTVASFVPTGATVVGTAVGSNVVSIGDAGSERRLTNVAAGGADTDAVNVSQLEGLSTTVDDNTTRSTGNLAALGGNAAYDAATDTYTAPTYTLDNGANTNTTADFDNVGDALGNLDGRTATNTSDIANIQTQSNIGFNISAAGGADDNVQLGETVDFTNTDGNLVVTNDVDNGINYDLAENIDLGINGSVTTGDTVVNNAGVAIDDGAGNTNVSTATGNIIDDDAGNVTTLTGAGTSVTDGVNTSNYGAEGFTATDGTTSTVFNQAGITFLDATDTPVGPSITATGIDAGDTVITSVSDGSLADGSTDAINGSQLNTAADSIAANLGGGSAFDPATGEVTAPTYTLDNGTNTNTTAAFDNVGDALGNLDGRTTINTGDIADIQAQSNLGFNVSAAGGADDNVQLGETVDFTNTDGNLVVTNDVDNGINYDLAENIDLGVNGSVTTGDTVVNNAGVAIDDGAGNTNVSTATGNIIDDDAGNVTTLTGAGTSVTDGVNTSNYGAEGFTATDAAGNNGISVNQGGISFIDGAGAPVGPSITATGIDAGDTVITSVASGSLADSSTDAINGSQLNTAADSIAANLGGGSAFDPATGEVTAPTYTLDNGTNTNTTAAFDNVGDALGNLDGRTTINTGDIADIQAQSNLGFNVSAAGGADDNVQLGETVDFTNTDGNLVVTNDVDNGINYDLAENIDLGVNGSVTTGDTVVNNAGVAIDDGAGNTNVSTATGNIIDDDAGNVTTLTGAGTSVTDGVNTSNYGAEGFTATDAAGNNGISVNQGGISFIDGAGAPVGPSITATGIDAGDTVITSVASGGDVTDAANATNGVNAGDVNTAINGVTAAGLNFAGDSGTDVNRPLGSTLDITGGSTATLTAGNIGVVANGTDGLSIQLAEAVDLGVNGSVTTGDTVVNNAGVAIDDGAGNTNVSTATGNIIDDDAGNVTTLTGAGTSVTDGTNTSNYGAEGFSATDAAGNNGISVNQGGISFIDGAGAPTGPSVTAAGFNAGNTVITNVASGGDVTDAANATNGVNAGDVNTAINGVTAAGLNFAGDSGTDVNRPLGSTLDITGGSTATLTAGNIGVVANGTDGLSIQLAEAVDLGVNGSVTTGDTVVNNAGVAIDDGAGNTNVSTATGNIIDDDAGNVTTLTGAGTSVTDGTNTSNYGAEGFSATDGTTSTVFNQAGITFLDATDTPVGPSITATGIDAGDTVITSVSDGSLADGSTDAINGSQLNTAADSIAANLGGGSAFDPATGEVTAPTYTLDNGTNTNTTAAFDNVGDALGNLDGRTTINTGDIADIQAQSNLGFNVSAAGGADDNVQLGETVDFTNTDGNLVVTNDVDNGINYDLAENIDLGVNGSVTTGDTVVNNAGVAIDDGAGNTNVSTATGNIIDDDAGNVTTLTGAGTSVTDGTNTSNYGAEGFSATDAAGNNGISVNQGGISFIDGAGAPTGPSVTAAGFNAGNTVITNVASGGDVTDAANATNGVNAGDVNTAINGVTAAGLNFAGDSGTDVNRPLGSTLDITGGSTATLTAGNIGVVANGTDGLSIQLAEAVDLGVNGSVTTGDTVVNNAGVAIDDGAGNATTITTGGTNVVDTAGNSADYTAIGSTLDDGAGNTNVSTATGNIIDDDAGNVTTLTGAGTSVTDGVNTSNYGAEGFSATDAAGNNGISVNQGGISFIDGAGAPTGPSVTAAGFNAGNTVITNVASGGDVTDAANATNGVNAGDVNTAINGVTAAGLNFAGDSGTDVNRPLGSTLDITGGSTATLTAGNIGVVANGTDGLSIQLAEAVDLGVNGSVTTGDTVVNNAGVAIDDGAGNATTITTGGTNVVDTAGNSADYTAIGSTLDDGAGNTNVSTATGNIIDDDAGNVTTLTGAGTSVTDGVNTSNYGAEGFTATDGTTSTVFNQAGITFLDATDTPVGPSITATGIDARDTVITSVSDGSLADGSTDAINGSQLNTAADSIAANLGGGSAFDPATGEVTAPTYTLDNGTNTNTTAAFDNVGDALGNLDGRTTINTGDIADIQAQSNLGFNVSAAGGADDNVQLGETVDFTNTDGNLVVTNDVDNGINYDLAENIDLGVNGSVTTGDTVVNNAGVAIDDGAGNTNVSTATGNIIDDDAGNVTTLTGAGTSVTDGTNTSNYGAEGFSATDAAGNNGISVNQGGISFIDGAGAPTGPSVTAAGFNAGNTVITNVASGGDVTDAANATNGVNAGDVNTAINGVTAAGLNFAGDSGTDVNRPLGSTLDITGGSTATLTAGNIGVVANGTDGLSIQLAEAVDLGVNGSVTTGDTVVNNAGVAIDDGAGNTNVSTATGNIIDDDAGNVTTLTGAGTSVTDGTNTSNYGAEGFSATDGTTSTVFNQAGITFLDATDTPVGPSITATGIDAGDTVITSVSDGSLADGSTDAINGSQLNTAADSIAANLGGGSAFDPATGEVTAPTYTLDNGTNTNTTAAFDNVGDALGNLDGRTTINTGDIADIQAQSNLGFNVSAAGGADDNVQLGETVDFTNTDGNLVVTNDVDNGINYDLAENIDLGVNGSVTTGDTVVNNAGVAIDDGAGNTNVSTATGNIIDDDAGNVTTLTGAGTSVTDGVNTSNYGAEGFSATDAAGNNGISVNQGGISFIDGAGAPTGPSVTAAGFNAGNTVITNVASGGDVTDAANATNGVNAGDVNTAINGVTAAGLNFAGDSGTDVNRPLGSTLDITGGSTATLTAGNIGVVANGTDGLSIQLAEAVDLGVNGSVTTGDTVVNNAGVAIDDGAGNATTITTGGTNVVDTAGNSADYTAIGSTLDDGAGNTNVSTATGNIIDDDAGNVTTLTGAGTNVTDGTNTSNYGAEGFSATDAAGNNGISVNQGGISFIDGAGAPTGPSVTAAGFNAGNTVITNVASGGDVTDAANATNGVNAGDVNTAINGVTAAGLNFAGDSGTDVNRPLGSTLDITGGSTATLTAGNIGVVANGTDGLSIQLAEAVDLGVNGSVTTGDTVVNNAGVAIDDGAGNATTITTGGTNVVDTAGNSADYTAIGSTLDDGAGNTNVSTATGNIIDDDAGNVTTLTGAGTSVTDGTNTSNYGAEGFSATDAAGNNGISVNQGGISFIDGAGAPTGPSVTAAGFNAGNTVITNVASGGDVTDAANATNGVNAGDVNTAINGVTAAGLNFAGDSGTDVNRPLGSTLDITGGSTATLTAGNIGVVANGTDGLSIQLAEAVDLGVNGSVTTGDTVVNNAGVAIDDGAGNATTITTGGTNVVDTAGNSADYTAIGSTLDDGAGNTNVSTATGNIIDDDAGNVTTLTGAGTSVTDGTNTSNYGAEGFSATDAAGNNGISVNQGGISFIDGAGAPTGPSVTAAGFNAGNTVITNVASGGDVTDAANATNGVNAGDVNTAINGVTAAGLNFAGDSGTDVNRPLGSTLDITGGSTATLTAGNIGVVANGTDGLSIQLAEAVDLGVNGSVTTGDTVVNNAGVAIDDGAGNATTITTGGTNVVDTAGNSADYTAIGSTLDDGAGNTNVSTATGNIIDDDAGNVTTLTGAGTNVTDGVNTSNYGAEGFTATDGTTSTVFNQAGITFLDATDTPVGPSITATGIDAGDTVITSVSDGSLADGSTDAINGSQLNTAADSIAANLGGGSAFDPATGEVTAPTYTLDNGTNTNTTAAFDNVGDALGNLDGRTTINTGDIADIQAQSNLGFNVSAAGGADDNVQLGETVDFTNTDGNLVVTNDVDNGINYDLAENIDLGVNGSVTTGDTVVNNAGVAIDDGAGNATTITTGGTNVVDTAGNSADYTAIGSTLDDGAGNTNVSTATGNIIDDDAGNVTTLTGAGTNVTDGNGNTGNYGAASTVLTDDSGNTNASAAIGNAIFDDSGNANLSGAIGNAILDDSGNVNLSGAQGNVIFDDSDNVTITSATGTSVTDGTNTSNYGAEGFTATDGTTSTVFNQAGITFLDATDTPVGPSITATGIDAGDTVITSVSDGSLADGSTDAINGSQLNTAADSIAANLGGGSAFDPATGEVTAPTYTLDNGTNTNTTAAFDNVGDALGNLDGRTTINTGDIADIQAQSNLGFNVSAAGGADDNVQLGETVDFTNTDGNLVVTNDVDNGINYDLAENIDLGVNGSVTTGDTVVNNAGVAIDDGAGNATTITTGGTNVVDTAGNSADYTAIGSTLDDGAGNTNVSTATGNIIDDDAGNVTTLTGAGTSVTDGTNTSNYGAEGFSATDAAGNNGISVNQGGISFIDGAGAPTGPSVTAAGFNAGGTVITNVADGVLATDAATKGQVDAVSDGLADLTAGTVQYDTNPDDTVNKGSITLGGGAAGTTITNVNGGAINAGSTDAINGGQLFDLGNDVAGIIGGDAALDADGNLTASNIGGTGANNLNDAIAAVNNGNAQANEDIQANTDRLDTGLSFSADTGTNVDKSIGDSTAVSFEGSDNITTTTTDSGIKFDLSGNISVDSVTADTVTTGNTTVNTNGVTIANGPSMTTEGINAGSKTITGVADGVEVNDAVNFGQLSALDGKLSNSVNELGYKINEVEDDANAGISAAMAMSSLPQAYIPGKSMVGGGIATYNGQSAVAIGLSKVSDNGRWVIKVNGTADTQGNAGGAVGAGFHF